METIATSPYITAALIGGAISLIGLFLKSIYDGYEKRRLYKERRNDMQKAIYAEISAFVTLQERNNLAQHVADITERIRNEDNFSPFVVREKHDAVYEAILADIHYLPVETIDTITRYYQRLSYISDMKDAMMSDIYRALPAERRALVYSDYIATIQFAFEEGKDALHTIRLFSAGGADAIQEYKSAQNHARSNQNKLEVKAWLDTHKNQ